MIVDSGKLTRSRLSCADDEKTAILDAGIEQIRAKSVVVDELVGTGNEKPGGRVTGALHNFEPGKIAYATVTSTGPAKVWIIPGDEFRAIVGKPEYALAVMAFLATEVRSGSKSIRALLNDLKKGILGESKEDDGFEIRVLCYDVSTCFQLSLLVPSVFPTNARTIPERADFNLTCHFVVPIDSGYFLGRGQFQACSRCLQQGPRRKRQTSHFHGIYD